MRGCGRREAVEVVEDWDGGRGDGVVERVLLEQRGESEGNGGEREWGDADFGDNAKRRGRDGEDDVQGFGEGSKSCM
ncbi:hypothetical protein GQ457_01G028830 [Hibiscus cannabinus]